MRQSGNPLARVWSSAEVEEEFVRDSDPVRLELLKFAKEHSADGQFVSPQVKQYPTFGLTIKGRNVNSELKRLMLFYLVLGWDAIFLYLTAVAALTDGDTMEEFRRRLKEIFGASIKADGKEVGISLSLLEKHMPEFKDLLLWFKGKAEATSLSRTKPFHTGKVS